MGVSFLAHIKMQLWCLVVLCCAKGPAVFFYVMVIMVMQKFLSCSHQDSRRWVLSCYSGAAVFFYFWQWCAFLYFFLSYTIMHIWCWEGFVSVWCFAVSRGQLCFGILGRACFLISFFPTLWCNSGDGGFHSHSHQDVTLMLWEFQAV